MTNRIKKIEKAINSMSDDKFSELLNDLGVKKEKQWVPEDREYYHYEKSCGNIFKIPWNNDTQDKHRLLMKNVFKTKEEAEAQRDFNIEKAKLIKEIEDSNDVIDWEDDEQRKWFLYYDYRNKKVLTNTNWVHKFQGTIYTTNLEFLENLIKNEPERIKKYLFGIGENE